MLLLLSMLPDTSGAGVAVTLMTSNQGHESRYMTAQQLMTQKAGVSTL